MSISKANGVYVKNVCNAFSSNNCVDRPAVIGVQTKLMCCAASKGDPAVLEEGEMKRLDKQWGFMFGDLGLRPLYDGFSHVAVSKMNAFLSPSNPSRVLYAQAGPGKPTPSNSGNINTEIKALIEKLNSKDPKVRREAINALTLLLHLSLMAQKLEGLAIKHYGMKPGLPEEKKIDPAQLPEIIAALEKAALDEDKEVSKTASKSLADLVDSRANIPDALKTKIVDDFSKLVAKNPNPLIRYRAAAVFGNLAFSFSINEVPTPLFRKTITALFTAARDTSKDTRQYASLVLLELVKTEKNERGFSFELKSLELKAFMVEPFCALLASNDQVVRETASAALIFLIQVPGYPKEKTGLPLARALKDRSHIVRYNAALAIEELIGSRSLSVPTMEKMIDPIVAALNTEKDKEIKEILGSALRKMRGFSFSTGSKGKIERALTGKK